MVHLLSLATPVAQAAASGQVSDGAAGTQWLMSGLAWLLPLGVALIGLAALKLDRAPDTGRRLVVMAGLAVLAYWIVGFGLQFGGAGLVYKGLDLGKLSREWSLLDVSVGPGWGMLGLAGFIPGWKSAPAAVLGLLGSHLPWVATAAVVLGLAWSEGFARWARPVAALLLGGAIYPLYGNWVLGGGWLANLGKNLTLGHGLADPGAGVLFLVPALLGLAGLLLVRGRRVADTTSGAELPPVHLPLLALTGLVLTGIGLVAALFGGPLFDSSLTAVERAGLNLAIGAVAGTLGASAYSWLATGKGDLLVAVRGGTVGLIALVAPAAFVPGWAALLVGLLAGVLIPLCLYLVDHRMRLDDPAGVLSTFVLGPLLGLVAVGFFADGTSGVSWNGIGADRFLGYAGLGVTGLFAQEGRTPGWQGQLYAQLVGMGAALVLALLLPWAIGKIGQLIARATRR